MSLWRLLGFTKEKQVKAEKAASPDTEAVRKIAAQLERLQPERARFIAMLAYILSRVAHADLETSAAETRAMERIVAEHGGLPEEQAVLVVEMARSHNRIFGGTDNFLVTRAFREMATQEQKLALLDCLYAVSSADHAISSTEDNEIRRIATELRVEHPDWIAVRSRYRDHLEVLKPLRSPAEKSPPRKKQK